LGTTDQAPTEEKALESKPSNKEEARASSKAATRLPKQPVTFPPFTFQAANPR